MKITRQIIAAAGFASLLFAPLAQAQTPSDTATANINLTVVPSSSAITFTAVDDISFGSIIAPTAGATVPLALACSSSAGVAAATRTIGGGSLVGNDATCGIVTVTAGADGGSYRLKVSMDPLTGEDASNNGTVIATDFRVFPDTSSTAVVGLNSIAGGASATATSTETLAGNASQTYKLGGTASIVVDQDDGTYAAIYTVEVLPQ